jgi:hypothetical protein
MFAKPPYCVFWSLILRETTGNIYFWTWLSLIFCIDHLSSRAGNNCWGEPQVMWHPIKFKDDQLILVFMGLTPGLGTPSFSGTAGHPIKSLHSRSWEVTQCLSPDGVKAFEELSVSLGVGWRQMYLLCLLYLQGRISAAASRKGNN